MGAEVERGRGKERGRGERTCGRVDKDRWREKERIPRVRENGRALMI